MVRRTSSPPSAVALALGLALAGAASTAGCGDDECKCADTRDADPTPEVEVAPDVDDGVLPGATALPGPAVRYGFARDGSIFDAPVPALDLFDRAGHPDLAKWPREERDFVQRLVEVAETLDGASLAGAVYFTFDAAVPEAARAGWSGQLIDVDVTSPEVGRVRGASVFYEDDGGPHGAPFMLSLLPTQGVGLRPGTKYLALALAPEPVTGGAVGRSAVLADLLAGRAVDTLDGVDRESYRTALSRAVDDAGVDPARIVALTVFRTADPTAELARFLEAARAEPAPDVSGFAFVEEHERFCVYEKTVTLPDYQHGALPFIQSGEGTWRLSAGRPEVARRAESRVFVTIPKSPAPEAGYPSVVFIRTGGGGDRPLIDRGLRGEAHGEPIVPTGTGPAMNLAAGGWAGVTWDGPHGGLRNPSGQDEQFLMFNVTNPAGTRDNIRQTALEAVLIREAIRRFDIDASGCAGASARATFDDAHTAIMGHSMGGWIAPIAMAHSDKFETAILSGAGGSWIANIVYKKSPLDVRPLAEQVLGYNKIGRSLGEHDPAATLLQWAGEAADPQSYAQRVLAVPRNVLMIEGIVDTYILPPIANTTALSLRLDLGGDAADASDARLDAFTPLVELLPLVDAEQLALPVTGNRSRHTAVVVQAPGDAIEDGHEAMFQTPGPKHQYRCFLASLLADVVPTVVVPGDDEWAPCP